MPAQRMISVGAVVGLLLTACGESNPSEHADGTMLTPYKEISGRLADDSVEGLPELAALVIQASEKDQGKAGVEDIVRGAQRVGSPDIATARAAFKTMSDGMVDHVRSESAKQTGNVIIHCTMAFNNEGALWVQAVGSVKNPYHGKMMLRCGDRLEWTDELPQTWAG